MTRKVYKYDPKTKEMYEVKNHPRSLGITSKDVGLLQNDRLYSEKPFVAHDGSVINSRLKHREYMKRHNLTTMDDFKTSWDRAAQDRAAAHTPGASYDKAARRETIERTIYQLENRRAKRR